MFFNPAALARQGPTQIVAVTTYVRPMTHLDVKDASTAAGEAIGGGNGGGNVTDDQLLPALYFVGDLSREVDVVDNLKVGLAITVPYGLATDYNSGWAGRYHALRSKVTTVNFGPTLSFDVLDGLSVGAGLQAEYADAELSNAIDFGSIGAAQPPPLASIAQPTQQDGKVRVKGHDWGFGWTAGAIYEPFAGSRFGVAYRSQVRHELDGNAHFRLDQDGVGAAISKATGAFTDTSAKATLEMPESLTFGVYQDIDTQWSVMMDAAWTRWSRIKELRVRFGNPAQPDAVTDADWKDSWFVATGVTYRPAEAWALRAGIAYDESPVPNRTRTPRVPDSDRYWVSVGASYSPSSTVDVSIGYTHIFGIGGSIDLSAGDPGNAAQGNLSSDVDASVDIFGVQLRWAF